MLVEYYQLCTSEIELRRRTAIPVTYSASDNRCTDPARRVVPASSIIRIGQSNCFAQKKKDVGNFRGEACSSTTGLYKAAQSHSPSGQDISIPPKQICTLETELILFPLSST